VDLPQLLPELMDTAGGAALVGIGTIINEHLPAGPKVIVGAGVGYGEVPRLSDDFAVHFVRGPRTARALGLPVSYAITDPAHLLTQLIRPVARRRGTVFIPHHVSAMRADWRQLARDAGMTYVDPASGVLSVIQAIRTAQLVVTSAMHGAIVADAFRVPWIRVREYAHLTDFKWQAWGDTLRVDTTARTLPDIHDHSASGAARTFQRVARAWMRAGRPYRPSPVSIALIESSAHQRERAVAALRAVSHGNLGTLSDDGILADRVEQLVDAVRQLRQRLCPLHLR
jgi:succinoglycan biosynthesis protein ExoV